jgi:hypothetical protein
MMDMIINIVVPEREEIEEYHVILHDIINTMNGTKRLIQPGDWAIVQYAYHITDITSIPLETITLYSNPTKSLEYKPMGWQIKGEKILHKISFNEGSPLHSGLSGNVDADRKIAAYLDCKSIMNLGATNKYFSDFITDDRFWAIKVDNTFPGATKFKPIEISFKQEYKDLLFTRTPDNAAENGYLYILKWMATLHPIHELTFNAFLKALMNGHVEVLEWLYGRNPQKIIEMVDELRDEIYEEDIDKIARNGHLSSVEFIFRVNPGLVESDVPISLSRGAANGDHYNILEWMRHHNPPLEFSLEVANEATNINMLNYLFQYGYIPVNDTFSQLAEVGDIVLMDWYYDHGAAAVDVVDLDDILIHVARKGTIVSLEWLYKKYSINFGTIIDNAIIGGHVSVLEWVEQKLAENMIDITSYVPPIDLIDVTVERGHLEVLKWAYSKWNILPCLYGLASNNSFYQGMLRHSNHDAICKWIMTVTRKPQTRYMMYL